MPRCSLVVIDSSRHRDGRLLCQQPGESCSGMANPLGSRAVAGPEHLMTQWSCGVVIAVEEVILFFNSLAQPVDRLDTGQGLSLGEVLTPKSFGAGRVMAVDSALELMVQKSFLLPRGSLAAVHNTLTWLSPSRAAGGPLLLLALPREQDRACLRPFLPLAVYHVLSLPGRLDPRSSDLRISAAYSS